MITEIRYRPLASLKKHSGNPRTIKDASFKKLVQSIDENPDYFEARPIILSDRTGELIIIAGNQRYAAAKEIGIKDVPTVVLPALTEEKEREIMIRDNISNGDWDFDLLAQDWDSGLLNDWGLDVPDWDQSDAIQGNTDPDEVPEPEPEPVTQLGDLWLLGDHRLLCGDSTSEHDVLKLFAGGGVDMCVTDPPYGVSVVKKGMVGADFGVAKKGAYAEVIGDETTDTAEKFYQLCLALGVKNFIIWGGNYFTKFLPPVNSWVVWNKRGATDIKNTFADCELAWSDIGFPARIHNQLWNGMIREGEKEKRAHPTQKPIKLFEFCFDLLKDCKSVYDAFLGSGASLIACEQTGRKCYGLELSPQYCDVIVKRWQEFTGKQATLESTGETWEQVKVSRHGS